MSLYQYRYSKASNWQVQDQEWLLDTILSRDTTTISGLFAFFAFSGNILFVQLKNISPEAPSFFESSELRSCEKFVTQPFAHSESLPKYFLKRRNKMNEPEIVVSYGVAC